MPFDIGLKCRRWPNEIVRLMILDARDYDACEIELNEFDKKNEHKAGE